MVQSYSAAMENVKICLSCQHINPTESYECNKCGAPLAALLPVPTTVAIPDRSIRFAPPESVLRLARTQIGSLILVVVGHEQPIILTGSEQVTLGRYNPGETMPSIDLTPYNADLLGVSRQHARIRRSENRYIIEDVGSTNGTWVNEIRLKPHQFYEIENGALIRLGQLGLYAYFEAVASPEETITLNNGSRKLTPQRLSSQVTPYLSALAGVQAVRDEFLGHSVGEVEILSLNADEIKGISIRITGAQDAIQLAVGKLSPWKENYRPQINRFHETNGAQDTGELEPIRRELLDAEIRFALDYLAELSPDQPEDRRKSCLKKLVTHLHMLVISPLQISAG